MGSITALGIRTGDDGGEMVEIHASLVPMRYDGAKGLFYNQE